MIDLRNPHQLFELSGILHKVIGWTEHPTVIIEPVHEVHYKKCECGRPLQNQQEKHVWSSRNLQNNITAVYRKEEVS